MMDTAVLQTREELWTQGYWEIPDGLDTSNFDFDWRPYKFDKPFIHQFGTQHQKTGGPRFVVPHNLGIKYQNFQHAIKLPDNENRFWRPLVNNATIDFSWHPDETDPPFIYVFGNQWYDVDTMPTYQYRVKGATNKKYMYDVKATLIPDQSKWTNTEDITEFDYSWIPHPHEPPFIWQFGTQHQKTGGPTFNEIGSTTIKYTDVLIAKKTPNLHNWRIIEPIVKENFDFSWHPDETDGKYNYIFGNEYHSSEHMPTIMYKSKGATENKYVNYIKAPLKIEQREYEDSIFDAVIEHKFESRYTCFGNIEIDYKSIISDDKIPHCHIIDDIAAIVPRELKHHIYDKLSDYPYVKRHNLGLKVQPLDIIFISNGESGIEENYQHLLSLVKELPNNVVHVTGINGRVASQHEAARQSSTPWYFLINGKLRVDERFDFGWQPSYLDIAKHYIFRATNPVNGLSYGHMAIVANNKKITLATTGDGLDFTLDGRHEIVNINSGVGRFNTSKWDTWRTAFREALKLKHSGDYDSLKRLDVWLTVAAGDFAEISLQGAKDAVEYYESVEGDFQKLKLSYDWAWLKEHYQTK